MFRDARACAITAPAQLARGPADPSAEARNMAASSARCRPPPRPQALHLQLWGHEPHTPHQASKLSCRKCVDSPPPRRRGAPPPTSRAEDRVSHRDRRGRPRPSGLPCPLRAGAANAGTHIRGVDLAGRWEGGGPAVGGFYCPLCSPGRKSEFQSEKKTRRGQQVRFEMLATQRPEGETTKVAL